MTSKIIVTETVSENSTSNGVKPAHWVNDAGTSFWNPWESYRHHTLLDLFSFMSKYPSMITKNTKEIEQSLNVRKPTWGNEPRSESDSHGELHDKLKATWLGHACFLVEFPSRIIEPSGEQQMRGVRVLFDPVFSDRCSPSQYMGPKRYTQPPCGIEEIPEIDAVVISHNHYDHLDTNTIQTLLRRTKRIPHFFAPLGNHSFFHSLGVPEPNIHIMDWWNCTRLEISFDSTTDHGENAQSNQQKRVVDITCTPSQHFTGRYLWDNFKTLWASWVVEEVVIDHEADGSQKAPRRAPVKVYFAGDTAYRTVEKGEDEEKVPVCPAFKEIGKKFGGFDFAMIPIGAYIPRVFTSRIHCAPQDSVRLFQDIKAKKAVGMHWGTWVLTMEDVVEPPKRLAEERRKLEIEDDAFITCDIGETLFL